MLGDDGSGSRVIFVSIMRLVITQRLDAMIRDDEEICVLIYVLQDGAENFVHGAILIREGVHVYGGNLLVVANVERLDGIEPMSHAIFTGLHHEGKVFG